MLTAHKFDLVIADVMCSEWEGIDMCSLVCKNYPETPVIATSLPVDLQKAAAAMRTGAMALIMKPFSGNQLYRLIGAALNSQNLKSVCKGAAANQENPVYTAILV